MTAALDQHPKGIGVWARREQVTAAKLRSMRARHVLIMVEAADGHVEPDDDVLRNADTTREAGAEPWLWSFPGRRTVNAPKATAERLTRLVDRSGSAGVVLNIEAPHFEKPTELRDLVRATLDGLTERHGIGVGSFPIARWHPALPWDELRVGFGLCELYETAGRPALAREAMADWRAWWPRMPDGATFAGHTPRVVLPCPAAFETSSPGERAVQLSGDLERICTDGQGVVDVPGATVWSYEQLDVGERAVLAGFAERAGW